MPTAGYSDTPLLKKLGITDKHLVLVIGEPDDYLQLLDTDLTSQRAGKKEIPDFVHLFAASKKDFESAMKTLKPFCREKPSIIIWVSWYKKSTGITTDLTENHIREYALKNDLVDVKVCAVSEQWSGLKLVVPLAKR